MTFAVLGGVFQLHMMLLRACSVMDWQVPSFGTLLLKRHVSGTIRQLQTVQGSFTTPCSQA